MSTEERLARVAQNKTGQSRGQGGADIREEQRVGNSKAKEQSAGNTMRSEVRRQITVQRRE